MRALLPVAALSLIAVGCHPPEGAGEPAFVWRPDLRPAVYFPLVAGSAWSYDVTGPDGGTLLLINHVRSMEEGRAIFYTAPDPLSYEDLGDRIVRHPSGTTVLKAPLATQAGWDIPGGSARILAVDGEVVTERRKYRDCLVVEERTEARRVMTSYCPGIGPTLVEIFARAGAEEIAASRAVLRSYQAVAGPP